MKENIRELLLKYYTAGSLKTATLAICPDPKTVITLELLQKILILARKLDNEGRYVEKYPY